MQQVQQQRGDQRAVHDRSWMAFDLVDVAVVEVDAMAAEGQCRVMEQQYIVWRSAPRPLRFVQRNDQRRLLGAPTTALLHRC